MEDISLGTLSIEIVAYAQGLKAGLDEFKKTTPQMEAEYKKIQDATKKYEQKATQSEKVVAQSYQHLADTLKAQGDKITSLQNELAENASGTASIIDASNVAIAASFAAMAVKVKQSLDAGAQAYASYQSAMTGVYNVARSKGFGQDELTKAIDGVVDELFTLQDATKTFQNFLIKGFNLEQITKMVNVMKETASVARKEVYTIGESISIASSGFRQELSTLADASGITTNLSRMYEVYAKSIGVAASALTDAQKNQAIYNGIMKDSEPFIGSYENAINSMSGSLSSVTQAKNEFNIAFGESNAEAIKLFNTILSEVLNILSSIVTAFPPATSAVTTFALSFGMFKGVSAATDMIKSFMTEGKATKGILAGLSTGFTVLSVAASIAVGVYTALKKAQEEARKAHEEYIANIKAEVSQRNTSIGSLEALRDRYNELAKKENLSASEKLELNNISKTLYEQYGLDIERLGGVAGAYDRVTEAINETLRAKYKEQADAKKALYDDKWNNNTDYKQLVNKRESFADLYDLINEFDEVTAEIAAIKKTGTNAPRELVTKAKELWSELQGFGIMGVSSDGGNITLAMEQYKTLVTDFYNDGSMEKILGYKAEKFTEYIDYTLDYMNYHGQEKAAKAGNEIAAAIIQAINTDTYDGADDSVFERMFENLISDETLVASIDTVKGYVSQIMKGAELDDSQQSSFEASWDKIGTIMVDVFGENAESVTAALRSKLIPGLNEYAIAGEEAYTSVSKLFEQAKNEAKLAADVTEQEKVKKIVDETKASYEELNSTLKRVSESAPKISAIKIALDVYQTSKKSNAELEKLNKTLIANGENAVTAGAEVNALAVKYENMASASDSEISSLVNELLGMLDTMEYLNSLPIEIRGDADVDITALQSKIASALTLIWQLIAAQRQANIDAGLSKKGGGGGSRESKAEKAKREAEKAAKEAEDARKKALQDDYDYIQYLSDLNRIQLEDKIRMHEAIRLNHALNLEEERKLEVELYNLREELRLQRIDDDYAYIAHHRAIGQMTLEQEISFTEAIRRNHELTAKEIQDLEETLYSLYEQKRQEDIDSYRSYHNYLVSMDRMTKEEQIASLERLLRTYQLTQQEIRDLEVEIYQLRKSLEEEIAQIKEDARNKEVSQLTSVTNAVIKALENRYKAMKDQEIKQLDESKEAWKKWSETNVEGIQEQIKALDKLKEARADEKTSAQQLRKIEDLKDSIAYETNEYNRLQLEKQLQQALSDREDWLLDKEVQAQKEALQAEIEAIKEKAKVEQEAIEKEKEALKALYEERIEQAKYEGAKIISEGDLQAVISLLNSYNKDFNLAGTTIGAHLYEGFTKSVASIENWMNSLMEDFKMVQEEAYRTSQLATESFYSGQQARLDQAIKNNANIINQTLNFNTPVDDYYEMQRRIEQANEELVKSL